MIAMSQPVAGIGADTLISTLSSVCITARADVETEVAKKQQNKTKKT
ncbi:MAG: hypothetical protein QM813_19540 [Verrucomicrobiota bacterium]